MIVDERVAVAVAAAAAAADSGFPPQPSRRVLLLISWSFTLGFVVKGEGGEGEPIQRDLSGAPPCRYKGNCREHRHADNYRELFGSAAMPI